MINEEYAIMDDKGIIYTGNQEEMENIFYCSFHNFEFFGDLLLIHIIGRVR